MHRPFVDNPSPFACAPTSPLFSPVRRSEPSARPGKRSGKQPGLTKKPTLRSCETWFSSCVFLDKAAVTRLYDTPVMPSIQETTYCKLLATQPVPSVMSACACRLQSLSFHRFPLHVASQVVPETL